MTAPKTPGRLDRSTTNSRSDASGRPGTVTILHAPNHAPDVAGAAIRLATRTGAHSIGMSEAYRVTRLLAAVDRYRLTVGRGGRDKRRGAKDTPILTQATLVSLGAGAVQISETAKPARLAPDRWLTFSLFESDAGPIAHLNLHPNAGIAHAVPFQPDVELIANAEGNAKILKQDREAAARYAAPARVLRVREYAESMKSLERYVRLFRLEGFLVVVTGDLNYPAELHEHLPVYAPAKVFERLDLAVWAEHLDYVAYDRRLTLTKRGVIDKRQTMSDHPWLLATFTRRRTPTP